MLKVLVPVDGSSNSQHAVRHILREFKVNPVLDIHLLNVQPAFSSYITRFVVQAAVAAAHQEASEKAQQPTGRCLTTPVPPTRCTWRSGKRSLRSRRRRGNCKATTLPLVQIAGDPASKGARYGIPVGVGAGLTWLAIAASE